MGRIGWRIKLHADDDTIRNMVCVGVIFFLILVCLFIVSDFFPPDNVLKRYRDREMMMMMMKMTGSGGDYYLGKEKMC